MSIFQQITSKNFQVGYKNAKFKEKLFNFSRYLSSNNHAKRNETDDAKGFVTFKEKIRKRRAEAKKSIIVQVQSSQILKEFYSYCTSFGNIKQMFHYTAGDKPMDFILVEFQQLGGVQAALASGTFMENNFICPTMSQFLWFRTGSKKVSDRNNKKFELSVVDGLKPVDTDKIHKTLQNCDNMSDQINALYEMSRLTDLESRLRFLTARQIELALSGMFPTAEVLPFGSSVNGFGKMGCDLDVVLSLNNRKGSSDSGFIFHCKGSSGVDKTLNPRNLETVGDILNLFLPGCTRVRKILQARVPIIKYKHQFTNVECDLSMSNLSGVHMSDFLYIMGASDPRVRPLVFAVRRWAKEVGLTNSTPGRWITNFSLTLLVLAFLQRPLHSAPVLPALKTLVKSAGPTDCFVTEEGVDCTFLRNINKLPFIISNTENLESLLCEFFEFYSQFDFKTRALCLYEAATISKPDNSALYIVNPLERGMNVSKNVSLEELDRFVEEVKNAAWMLQSSVDSKSPNWGLLSVIEINKRKPKFPFNFNAPKKLLSVEQLFADQVDNVENSKIEFKNDTVRDQVNKIKKETHEMLKTFKSIKEPVR